jgi:carbon-monoxide dehydrogenase large subunit
MSSTTDAPISIRPPQYVGARVLRTEDPKFLTGRARYTDDVKLPGMCEAAFLRSPYPHARIKSIDTSEAKALEGVLGVYTGEDLEGIVGPFETTVPGRDEVIPLVQKMLPTDKARHVGDAIVAVVAEDRYIAEDAIDVIEIDWEVLEPVIDPERALEEGSPLIHEDLGHNNFAHMEYERGDVAGIFEKADHVFSKRFHAGRFTPAPLETRAVVADYNNATDEMIVWTSSQTPHLVRSLIAPPLGVPETKIRVIADAVGGGFGMKCQVFKEEVLVPALSKLIGRPVKWIEDRYENLAASIHAKEVISYIDIACDANGKFLAIRAHYIGVNGGYQAHPWTALVDPMTTAAALPNLYDFEALRHEIDCPYTNKCMIGAYRGVGRTPGTSAREALIDEIARKLDIDPIELRLRNTIDNEAYESLTGAKYDSGTYKECIEKAREFAKYDEFRDRQGAALEDGRYIGMAFIPYVEPTAWGSDIAKVNGYHASEIFDAASVTVEPDGSVSVTCGLHNHGQGLETSLAQVTADQLGVRLESVNVFMGDTSSAPYGFGTHSSRSAVIGGGTIMRASREVKEKMVRLAANLLEVSTNDIEIYDGSATVKGVPGKAVSVGEIATHAYFGGRARPDEVVEPALTATRSYDPLETWPNGCVVAEVEVDPETGRVQVTDFFSVEDCGVILNPMIVEGQTAGAVAQGIGGALYEDLKYDPETGQFLAGTLMDYLYPSTTEVPGMNFMHVETPSPVTEGGMKGMGEGGLSVAPAAVLNAVADALSPLGVEIDRSPLDPNTLLGLIREAREGVDHS